MRVLVAPSSKQNREEVFLWYDGMEYTPAIMITRHGISVTRRFDTNMVNGSKLLALIARVTGKDDCAFEIGPECPYVYQGAAVLQGTWIPYEQALQLVEEKMLDHYVYPLFEKDMVVANEFCRNAHGLGVYCVETPMSPLPARIRHT